jgi:hypothetical protein
MTRKAGCSERYRAMLGRFSLREAIAPASLTGALEGPVGATWGCRP